jgi:NADPH:quinone reductase-like Zn-dependent oxidoreductase
VLPIACIFEAILRLPIIIRSNGTRCDIWIISSAGFPIRISNVIFLVSAVQTLKKLKPDWFHEDLILLFDMLKQGKIKPLIARRMSLNQATEAHELLVSSSAKGKIVLICNN